MWALWEARFFVLTGLEQGACQERICKRQMKEMSVNLICYAVGLLFAWEGNSEIILFMKNIFHEKTSVGEKYFYKRVTFLKSFFSAIHAFSSCSEGVVLKCQGVQRILKYFLRLQKALQQQFSFPGLSGFR